ncbi:hypothetical protein [Alicyclobacillus acidoterrestris]|uniref:Uncharacterized protein n=1 Tax=Alicyclobacillus acidoterrestris (strain ATCC 49025 / DSM 3922 / CIP 106132 / NCIMB 13137 / GD3B) TaxID=1356854 RepID=T0BIM4_ALIAG|nr:hypothetical protein [Alicyclobacillus acidoterrestris]EPZ43838.1 hypothetical protein N007_12025 [Alicyclobacillus acidoterrestris ATCC 49025]UNO49030.1 hypothetical protein K1I37_00185 [Alicyclobacillus acidoterrestris]
MKKRVGKRVMDVFIFRNGIVAVCDEKGEQIPELQGRWERKAIKILRRSTAKTRFFDCRVMTEMGNVECRINR